MMLIACPFCGARPQSEFRCGGQTGIARPAPADQVGEAQWADYLYVRDNPKGAHYERWCHQSGCGSWFNLLRDTLTHRILAVARITDPRPAPESAS